MNLKRVLLAVATLAVLLLAWSYGEAIATPDVRRLRVSLTGWPAGARPLKAVLISDIHVAGPDMPPKRLRQIVDQINALKPDVVLIAGDLVSDKRVATRL